MAGHSHWAGIKHKKAKEDAKRGKVFSRLAKQIMTAVRSGGKDPDTNLDLRYAIDAAKAVSMPKANIERAVKKGAGELGGAAPEAIRLEGHGVKGVAIVVDVLTDNRNRTTPHMRKIFSDFGGDLGTTGCVGWNFDTKGIILLDPGERDPDEIFEIVVEGGAEDIQPIDDVLEITSEATDLQNVKNALIAADIVWESAELALVPKMTVDLDAHNARRMIRMIDAFEDDEDVTSVATNFDITEEVAAELEADE